MEEQTTTIRITEKLWNFLNQEKKMSESFEDVIWRYIKKKDGKSNN
jgi:predicted CopG family antitoxin